jgi:hypothetical protein
MTCRAPFRPEVLPYIPTPAGYDRFAPAAVGKDEQQCSVRGRPRLVGRERGIGRFVGQFMILDWPHFGATEVGLSPSPEQQHVPAPVPVRLHRWAIDAIGA